MYDNQGHEEGFRTDEVADNDPVLPPNVRIAEFMKLISWFIHHREGPLLPKEEESKEKTMDVILVWDQ